MAGLASLAALEGRWRLARRIENADGSTAASRGPTLFRRSGHRLVQEEDGWLRLPRRAGPCAPRGAISGRRRRGGSR
jgi:hypothetical protein